MVDNGTWVDRYKDITSHGRSNTFKDYPREAAAARERLTIYRGHAVWYGDACEGRAVFESIIPNRDDVAWYGYASK